MGLQRAMADALEAQPEVDFIACVDLPSGRVLAAEAKHGRSCDTLALLAMASSQLCLAPALDGPLGGPLEGGDDSEARLAREALVVSSACVHAFVVSARAKHLAIVGAANAQANVALLLALLRCLADAAYDAETP